MKTPAVLVVVSLVLAPLAFPQGEPQGTIKATTKLRPDGSTATTILNPDTQTAEETHTQAGGKVIKKTVFKLDDRNFATSAFHYDANGKMRYKESYQRDGADRISEARLYSPDDKPLGRRVFSYDAKGAARIDDFDAEGRLIARPEPARKGPGRPVPKKR